MSGILRVFILIAVIIVVGITVSDTFQETVAAEDNPAWTFEGTWQSTDGRRLRIDNKGTYLSIREILKNGSYGATVNAVLSSNSADQCGTQGGWFYDDPTADSKIRICPGLCASLITQINKKHNTRKHKSKRNKSR